MTNFKLGINLICAGNRYPEPEVWTRLVREDFDLDYVQFSADLLDPLWPHDYVSEYLERTKDGLDRYELVVESLFTGNFTRRHLLLHPDFGGREMWFEWYKALIRIAAELGATAVGSHFGALSVRDASDPDRFQKRVDEAVRLWQELSRYGRDQGLNHLFFETMSIQREMASTIEDAKALYERLNENASLPIYMCLDVGHAPHPSQRDPYRWLNELSKYTSNIHLQQTEPNASKHWPFTNEYNIAGIIDPEKVISSIESSGVEEMSLYFEILHKESYEQESRVIPEIKESIAYWREFLKQHNEIRMFQENEVSD